MTSLPDLIAFDLDDTLAPSKTRAPEKILSLLLKLLNEKQVAVISGGNFEQFETQLVDPLSEHIDKASALGEVDQENAERLLSNLHLLPTCGTRYYTRENNRWHANYEENLSFSDRALAAQTLESEARRLGFWEPLTWGEIIEDRASQITFSALGQRAPVEAKIAWDPEGSKKNALSAAVQEKLPHLEVRSGGSTSVDITKKGIDKAYGMRKLEEQTGISLDKMLFIGDRLDESGNDYPVLKMGVACHAVSGWEETAEFLEELVNF